MVLTPGEANDSPVLPLVLDAASVQRKGLGRPRKRPTRVTADKAYSNCRCRSALRSRRIQANIPARSDQIARREREGSDGGRPYAFDKENYKLRSWAERCINRLKQFRRVATRYEKLADNYQAVITFASILVWLRS